MANSHFGYHRFPGTAAEAECSVNEDENPSFAAYKAFCVNGEWGWQEYSDVACNTPNGSPYVYKANGECYGGFIAGCGSYDCEDVDGQLQCDYTPDKSVYETTSATTTTGLPKATDVFAMKLHPTGKCSDETDTMMFFSDGGFTTKFADAQCDDTNKAKRWCEDGEVMVQQYSDSDCKTKKGDAKVSDECLSMGDSAAKISLDGCGNYMCSKDGGGTLTCDYTKKNSSNKTSGTEMQRGLAMGMLAVAVVLAA